MSGLVQQDDNVRHPSVGTRPLDCLVDNFSALASTAAGIVHLRTLVLGLALHGRLLSPRSPTADVGSAANPAGLPPTWKWVTVGAVADCMLGKMLDKSKHTKGTKRPYLRNLNVRWADFDMSDLREMFFEDDELERYGVRAGDVLICEGGEPGRAAVWRGKTPILIQKAIHRVRLNSTVLPDWLIMNLRYDTWTGRLDQYFTGATIKHFTGKALEGYTIRLPPLAEQERLLAKADELMRLLDDLEAKQTTQRETQARLRSAALDALTSAEGPEELAAAWRQVAENFDVLFEHTEGVEAARAAILALAVRGRLVAQDATDTSAIETLQRVITTTQREQRGPLNDKALPVSWVHATADELCSLIVDGDHNPPTRVAQGVPHLTAKNVRDDRIDFTGCTFISEATFSAVARRYTPQPGDVLLTCVGTLGRTAIVESEVFSADRNIAALRPDPSLCTSEYLQVLLKGPTIQALIASASGSTAQPHLYLRDIRALPCPLPPLSEQRRIVATVEHLMKLCDDLEAKLQQADETAGQLVEAVVAELVAA